jgi:hypothetical protein
MTDRPIDSKNEFRRLANAVTASAADKPAPVRNAATVIAQNLRLARRYPNARGLPSVLACQVGRMGGAK